MIDEFLGSIEPSDITALWILACAAVVAVSIERRHRLAAWSVWAVALVAVTAPWADFQAHGNWAHVGWIPFQAPPLKRADMLANVALYIPFGYVACGSHPGLARRLIVSMSTAGALSFVLETSQLFSVSRYPSATDVACDIAGAAAGALLAALMAPFLGRPEREAFIPQLAGDAGSRASRLACRLRASGASASPRSSL